MLTTWRDTATDWEDSTQPIQSLIGFFVHFCSHCNTAQRHKRTEWDICDGLRHDEADYLTTGVWENRIRHATTMLIRIRICSAQCFAYGDDENEVGCKVRNQFRPPDSVATGQTVSRVSAFSSMCWLIVAWDSVANQLTTWTDSISACHRMVKMANQFRTWLACVVWSFVWAVERRSANYLLLLLHDVRPKALE